MSPSPRPLALAATLAAALALPTGAAAQPLAVAGGTVTLFVAQLSPVPTTYTAGTDFRHFVFDAFAGSAPFTLSTTARLADVALGGCTAANFAGFVAGSIALIDRGTCNFDTKYLNAQAAGATGVLFVNNTGTLVNMAGDPDPTIPVFLLSESVGATIRGQAGGASNTTMTLSYAFVPTVVPEPATLALTGAGLLLLGAGAHRRRAAR